MPAGTDRIDVAYTYNRADGNALDIGLFDAGGIGLGRPRVPRLVGRRADVVTSSSRPTATPGYRPGPIEPGRWHVILGPYTGRAARDRLHDHGDAARRRRRRRRRRPRLAPAAVRRRARGLVPRRPAPALGRTPTACSRRGTSSSGAGGRPGLLRLHGAQHGRGAARSGAAFDDRSVLTIARRGGDDPRRPLGRDRPARGQRGSTGATGPRTGGSNRFVRQRPPGGRAGDRQPPRRAVQGVQLGLRRTSRWTRSRCGTAPGTPDDALALQAWDGLLRAGTRIPAVGATDAHRAPGPGRPPADRRARAGARPPRVLAGIARRALLRRRVPRRRADLHREGEAPARDHRRDASAAAPPGSLCASRAPRASVVTFHSNRGPAGGGPVTSGDAVVSARVVGAALDPGRGAPPGHHDDRPHQPDPLRPLVRRGRRATPRAA